VKFVVVFFFCSEMRLERGIETALGDRAIRLIDHQPSYPSCAFVVVVYGEGESERETVTSSIAKE